MAGGLEGRDVNTEKKVLGTNWNYVTDEFLFKFQTNVESAQGLMATKRNVLRVTASFYNTMSLISPIIVQMKILLQDTCKADYHWDAELDSELKTRWMKLISELRQVNVIQIPRCVTSEPDTKELVYMSWRLSVTPHLQPMQRWSTWYSNPEPVLKSDWLHQKVVLPL